MTDRRPSPTAFLGVSRGGLALLAGVVLFFGVALGVLTFALFGGHGGGDDVAGGPGESARRTSPNSRAPEYQQCTDSPRFDVTSTDITASGFVFTADISTSCAEGDVLSGSAVQISSSVGDRDFTSGVFDLGSDPIAIPAGGSVQRTFAFPLRSYWRIPELIGTDTLDVVVRNYHSTPATGASLGTSWSLTATGPAQPGHGSAEGTATNALKELSAYDFPTVMDDLADTWIPQISSKKLGLVVDGVTYDSGEILFDHLTLRQHYDDVRLVWSGQWTTFSSPDFWVTVVGEPAGNPAVANAWCDAKGIEPFNCFAKWVSSRYGPEGTTVMRK